MASTQGNLWQQLTSGVFVVAEIGKNFIQSEEDQPVNAYLENAYALVRAAKEAGADAVKFQTHTVEDEVLNLDFDSPHFKGKSRYAWVTRNTEATPLEGFWRELQAYCQTLGIVFFSTPMSRAAAMKLESISVPMWKVASSDILDYPMLEFMASTGKPIMIPTGMSTIEDVDASLAFLTRRNARVVLLHAISRYPYPPEDSNLCTITFFRKRYPTLAIGFSQNSPWVEPAVLAAALGAKVIEQHFTFDRSAWGPDHKVSMMPDEFARMVAGIRAVQADEREANRVLAASENQVYLGREEKFLQQGEEPFRPLFRKSLMASGDIPAGTTLSAAMLYAMRPQQYAGGLPSERYESVLGRRVNRALKKYDPITVDVLA